MPTRDAETVKFNHCVDHLWNSLQGGISRRRFREICRAHDVDNDAAQAYFESTPMFSITRLVTGKKSQGDRFEYSVDRDG